MNHTNKKANCITAERVEELRKNIDFSDIPEVTDFSGGKFKNHPSQKLPNIYEGNLEGKCTNENFPYYILQNPRIRSLAADFEESVFWMLL